MNVSQGSELDPGLAAVMAAIPEWDGLDPEVTPITIGITNRNFRVRLGQRDYVLRLPGKDTELLGISREAERIANGQAARLGIARPVRVLISMRAEVPGVARRRCRSWPPPCRVD